MPGSSVPGWSGPIADELAEVSPPWSVNDAFIGKFRERMARLPRSPDEIESALASLAAHRAAREDRQVRLWTVISVVM